MSRAGPATLTFDVGGSYLKASVIDSDDRLLADPVRAETGYPCPPLSLVRQLRRLVAPLPTFDRISVGFPGKVRRGRVVTAPHFTVSAPPGVHGWAQTDAELERRWSGFDLAGSLEHELGKPIRVVNDSELHGAGVIEGVGIELVITLGTGFGSALFGDGRLAPHLEFALHPFRMGDSYNQQVGEAARRRVGDEEWNQRVALAVRTLDALIAYDHIYVGGGNARRVTVDLGHDCTIVDGDSGLHGGSRLWTLAGS